MANPTFDGMDLTTDAAAEHVGTPRARVFTETLPGVKGEYAQTDRCGGRDITVTGIYRGLPAALPQDAQAALKDALRALQAQVAEGVKTYVGTDGRTYPACVLKSYQPVGPLRYVHAAGNYQAVVRVQAVIRDLAP
jgi:hypothetical protein